MFHFHVKLAFATLLNYLIYYILQNPNQLRKDDSVVEHIRKPPQGNTISFLIFYVFYAYIQYSEHQLDGSFGKWTNIEIIGMFLGIFGSVIRIWSFQTLGNLFTFDLTIRSHHNW